MEMSSSTAISVSKANQMKKDIEYDISLFLCNEEDTFFDFIMINF